MPGETHRKTPEQILSEIQPDETAGKKGYLKIVLGYASGVGKSLRMLDEARRRRERGQDVVIAAVQSYVPPAEDVLVRKMESISLKRLERGDFIDVETLIRR